MTRSDLRWPVVLYGIAAQICLVAPTLSGAVERHVPGQYGTIRAAIAASDPGEEVVIAEGTYTGAGIRDLSSSGKATTIHGTLSPDPGASKARSSIGRAASSVRVPTFLTSGLACAGPSGPAPR